MEHVKHTKHFKWGYIAVGVLFIAASIFAYLNPTTDLKILAVLIGIMPIVDGIWLIINRNRHPLRIVAGALEIFIGFFILLNSYTAIIALPFLFSIWFIANSILRFMMLDYARVLGKFYFWFSLLLNVAGIVLGVILLFNPWAAVLTLSFIVGSYLAIIGIECLAFSTSY